MEQKVTTIEDGVKEFRRLANEIEQLLATILKPPYDSAAEQKIQELVAKLNEVAGQIFDIMDQYVEVSSEYADLEPCFPGEKVWAKRSAKS